MIKQYSISYKPFRAFPELVCEVRGNFCLEGGSGFGMLNRTQEQLLELGSWAPESRLWGRGQWFPGTWLSAIQPSSPKHRCRQGFGYSDFFLVHERNINVSREWPHRYKKREPVL